MGETEWLMGEVRHSWGGSGDLLGLKRDSGVKRRLFGANV
jgi:hypothetical protein